MCSVDKQTDSASLRQPCFPPPVASRQGEESETLVKRRRKLEEEPRPLDLSGFGQDI